MNNPNWDSVNYWPLQPPMGCGHTDDVANKYDPEAKSASESSAVLPDINVFGTVQLIML
ncbi:MAG: hypothetical protein ACKVH8_23185 [Pirellulales bacterium]